MIKLCQIANKAKGLPAPNVRANSLTAAVVCSLLSACGGSSSEGPPQALAASSNQIIDLPADTISRIGTVTFAAIDGKGYTELGFPSGYVVADAVFTDYHEVLNNAFLSNRFPAADTDTCLITIDSTDDSQNTGLENNSEFLQLIADSSTIAAGEALSISTPSTSWPDLILSEETFGEVQSFYYEFQTDTSSLGTLPAGSSISIPGDEFPAFLSLSIPTVAQVKEASLSNIVGGLISPETTVTWAKPQTPNSNEITTISSYVEVTDNAKNAELSITMICTVDDDGEFNFPNNAKQVLSEYNIPAEQLSLGRFGVTSEVQGDAAAIVINASVYSF